MIKKNIIKVFALSFCMSALLTGVAYANSISPAYEGTASTEKTALHEMQKEIDQYIFFDNINEIEKMGFEVVYTGVSTGDYVEIGITPYTEENADFLYRVFGKENLKIVAADEVVLYAPDELIVEDLPADSGNVSSPVMDMGDDTPVSNTDYDEELIREREKLASADGGEDSHQDIDDLIRQNDIAQEDMDIEEDRLDVVEDTGYMTTQDDSIITVAQKAESDTAKEKGAIITIKNIAIAVGVIIVLGGTTILLSKKRAMKNNK
ncbi:MAG: hypothetical protein GX321_01370 [Clostridiales bacterium]|nr:hypothetical protein [Clostridiales bacterium]